MLDVVAQCACVSVDDSGGSQDVVNGPDAFQLPGHARSEHRNLTSRVGFAAHRLGTRPVQDRDLFVVAGDGDVEDGTQQPLLAVEEVQHRVGGGARGLGDLVQDRCRIPLVGEQGAGSSSRRSSQVEF